MMKILFISRLVSLGFVVGMAKEFPEGKINMHPCQIGAAMCPLVRNGFCAKPDLGLAANDTNAASKVAEITKTNLNM